MSISRKILTSSFWEALSRQAALTMLVPIMSKTVYGDPSPIAAIATSLGGALSIVRVSGPEAILMAAKAFSRPEELAAAAGYQAVYGWVIDGGRRMDEVVALVFRAPASYTGEDAVEFSCHGGPAAARGVLNALLAAGFREALPGEFSLRAFLNGKIDLTRAEAVAELAGAKNDLARDRAIGRLSGTLEREIDGIKRLLVSVLAAVEIRLDYSEEDGVYDDPGGVLPELSKAEEVRRRLVELQASYRVERIISEGALVAVAGLPNAGKSSLFNCLVKEERSIVSETPGTTRDWIEAWLSIGAFPIRLVDTAGLRDSADTVERMGVNRSREVLEKADVILYLVDGSLGIQSADTEFLAKARSLPLVPIWTKVDLDTKPAPSGFLPFSAVDGRGISTLASAIVACLEERNVGDDRIGIASERQKGLIDRSVAAIDDALAAAASGLPLDVVAPDLREAVNALGEITGEISTDDILATMFSRFCVGK